MAPRRHAALDLGVQRVREPPGGVPYAMATSNRSVALNGQFLVESQSCANPNPPNHGNDIADSITIRAADRAGAGAKIIYHAMRPKNRPGSDVSLTGWIRAHPPRPRNRPSSKSSGRAGTSRSRWIQGGRWGRTATGWWVTSWTAAPTGIVTLLPPPRRIPRSTTMGSLDVPLALACRP